MNVFPQKQEFFCLPSSRNDGGLLGKEVMLEREMLIPLREGGGTWRNMRQVPVGNSS